MYLKSLLFLFLTFSCCASDTNIPEIEHDIGLKTWTLSGAMLGVFYYDASMQSRMQKDISVDDGGNAKFTYSLQQRIVSLDRQKAIVCGVANFAKFLACPDLPFTMRPEIDPISVVESALLPTVVYIATKPIIDAMVPRSSQRTRFMCAASAALTLPHAIIATGADPQRILYNSFFHYMASEYANRCADVAGLKQITASLSYGSKVMPVTQMLLSRYLAQPSMLTVHPVWRNGDFDKWGDLKNGIVPALVLAGVDLGFNMIATTPVGAAIESLVDQGLEKVVKPLPKHMQSYVKRGTKKTLEEGVKIGATVAILKAAETQGCVVM